jgi:predicted phosphoribosyltransferase
MFQDRREAGRVLAAAMRASRGGWEGSIVLGLPRGGVPVAFEVARELALPLDILVVRKLGVPGQEELAMGAVASGGTVVVNQAIVHELGISMETVEQVAAQERREIGRRERAYRDGREPANVEGRTAVLVDDGLATGASMLAAARSLRARARQVVVAVPVAAASTCEQLRNEVDQVICAATPDPFFAVGRFYRNFEQTTDQEVRDLLSQARHDESSRAA